MLPSIRKQNLNWFPNVFNDLFNDEWFSLRNAAPAVPAMNVKECDKAFELEMAVPGLTKEDVQVQVNDKDQLVVSVEKKEEKKEDDRSSKFLRREFNFTHFEQTLLLPQNVDRESITAKVHHGVLHIKLPKLDNLPVKEPNRLIEIQ